jgi:carbamoyltransferase
MTKNNTISIYGSHDASVTFIDHDGLVRVYEYERYVKKRYAMFSSSFDNRADFGSSNVERRSFLGFLKKKLAYTDVKNILYAELNGYDMELIKEFFPNAEFKIIGHHYSHACSGFHSSGFDKAVVFSVDGGGVDANDKGVFTVNTTQIYIGENNVVSHKTSIGRDYGNPYSAVAFLISEIKPGAEGPASENSLAYAGKIMGLCAYGEVRKDWVEHFYNYYNHRGLRKLCADLNIPYGFNSVNGKLSYDLAATSQYVFEQKMNELIFPYVLNHNSDVVLVGGCALNVLYNQKLYEFLKKKNLNLFIPPNPNDSGESYGMFLSEFPECGKQEVAYNGLEVMDYEDFGHYLNNYSNEEATYERIVDYLKDGKIIGIINGNSEVGPRALGNRSIICDPSFEQMKDILNAKVKFREWYRPFAPVCMLEDKDLYFRNSCESKYMSYAPEIREGFRGSLGSIVHADNSTRLQTVTEKQHSVFYNILLEMKRRNHIPVILNTSFNIKGQPILSSLKDAFYVLDNTELDFILTGNKIFSKK